MNASVTINFLGDVMLGERFEKFNRGVISQEKKNINPFKYSNKDLVDADLTVANLECVVSHVSTKSYPFSKFMLIEPERLNILLKNNIKIVNIANNHIFDHGDEAFFETRKNLEEIGIKYFGFGESKSMQTEPVNINVGNKTIGFLGYDLSNTSKEIFRKKVNEILNVLESINKTQNILVLSLHWGYEYTDIPTSFMIDAAKKFIEKGVDIIYGHHPHILQGVTKLNNKIFAPSLGNFIFDDEREKNRFTGILKVFVDINDNLDYSFKPFFINERFQPIHEKSKEKDFLKLTNKLKKQIKLIETNSIKCETIDNDIIKTSNIGHLMNKKRVRKEIISNFKNYIPFIVPIFQDKIINKRLKKLFN